MLRRSNPWPSLVDLFSALLIITFASMILADRNTAALTKQKCELQKQMDILKEKNAKLEEQINQLRSSMLPNCDRKEVEGHRIIDGPLFEVIIRGTHQYDARQGRDGRSLTLEQMITANQDIIDKYLNICRFSVDVYRTTDISASEYDQILDSIIKHSLRYNRKRGAPK